MTREEAINKVRQMSPLSLLSLPKGTIEILQALAPELKESEDERIRKEMIDFINYYRHNTDLTTEQAKWCKEALDWLKKQKEQRSLNISAASEWLRENVCHYMNSEYNEFHKRVEYDGSIDKETLINDFEEAMQKEQKP